MTNLLDFISFTTSKRLVHNLYNGFTDHNAAVTALLPGGQRFQECRVGIELLAPPNTQQIVSLTKAPFTSQLCVIRASDVR
jgi:hypothetical protein